VSGSGLPPPDPSLLTPNDLRRLRVALEGRDPQELLGGGAVEDIFQTMILAYRLRDDPACTWEQAGDVAPKTMFDMSGGEPPPPLGGPPGSPGPASAPRKAASSRKRRATSAPAPSSAASSPSPPPSTTP